MSDDSSLMDSPSSPNSEGSLLREQDRYLPIANISRIMKKALPSNAKIAKDAKETVQECVSEFISFITSEASERCHMEKRKTINGEDILFAMNQLGFDNYIEPLKIYLQKYRDAAKCDRNLKPSDMLYEEGEENYNAPASSSIITDTTSSSSEAVIYAYQDNNQLHQFQIG